MITISHWLLSDKTLHTPTVDELRSRRDELLGADGLLWIDLSQPTEAEEQFVLQEFLRIHSLSFEDATRLRREPEAPPHLPKVEEFPDYLFVIINPLHQNYLQQLGTPANLADAPKKPLTQLTAVLTRQVLITHHYEPLTCIECLRKFLSRHEAQGQRGPDYLYHLILDSTVDEFAPVLDHIEETLEELETSVMESPRQELYRQLLRLKREIILLRKSLIAEREVLVRLARGEFELVDERETVYYRNVYDHLVRFADLMEGSRDMATDLMQTFLSAQSNHLNQIMKVLTMISTIGMICTVISGIYGMNFEFDPDARPLNMPELRWKYGYLWALGLMATAAGIAAAVYRWMRWF